MHKGISLYHVLNLNLETRVSHFPSPMSQTEAYAYTLLLRFLGAEFPRHCDARLHAIRGEIEVVLRPTTSAHTVCLVPEVIEIPPVKLLLESEEETAR